MPCREAVARQGMRAIAEVGLRPFRPPGASLQR